MIQVLQNASRTAPVTPAYSRPHALRARSLTLALVVAGLAACSPAVETPADEAGTRTRDAFGIPLDAPVSEEARAEIGELMALFEPMNPELTSDHHDQQWFERHEVLPRLMAADKEIGIAALHAYTGDASDSYLVRRALLWVGGHAAPEEARELLKTLMLNYKLGTEDGGDYVLPIGDRTEAALVLARTSPEVYLSVTKGYLTRREAPHQTMPNDEFLLDGWIAACVATGTSPVPMLADVATNLAMDMTSRGFAAKRLREFPLEPDGEGALLACLVESTGDGNLRRMAAQSLRDLLPNERGCREFHRVYQKEIDLNFRAFLYDLIQDNCRGLISESDFTFEDNRPPHPGDPVDDGPRK